MFPEFVDNLNVLMKNFQAGQLSLHLSEWESLTSDPEVLQIVRGDVINFTDEPPVVHNARQCGVSPDTHILMDNEIYDLKSQAIIVQTHPEEREYISHVFPVIKKDKFRLILNLKNLNTYVEYLHFKMDNIKTVLANVTQGCYMTSLDLKHGYHSVKIDDEYQKYLKFQWNDHYYQYTCYPNGLAPCPRKFTKLLKVPLLHLRENGHIVIGYLDDFFMQGQREHKCFGTLFSTTAMLQRLGFTIHPGKSHLTPSQIMPFLGFVINSVSMTVALTTEKKLKLVALIEAILNKNKVPIRELATIIGKFVSSLPGSLYGPLYYRTLELEKNEALKRNRGNYESLTTISENAKNELLWWLNNIPTMSAPIQWPPITSEMSTDASGKIGWGASVLGTLPTGGAWAHEQLHLHINVKEMLGILYGLRSFVEILKGQHVRVLCDNTTAVHVVNKMGTTRSPSCNAMAKEIWEFCRENDMFITCAFIPGKENIVADKESRKEHKQSEWMLNRSIFNAALAHFNVAPDIDCFATRVNAQIDRYVSRHPDPYASLI